MPSETPRQIPDALIDIDHVTFGYDPTRTILHDVSLSFERGKVTAIMGGSGCGKTTMLRLIGGMHRVQKGAVRIGGEALNTRAKEDLYRLRRRMGMLFQFGALFTDLSVFDNVAFPLREHTELDETMIRDVVLMKLNAVGLRGAAPLRISAISGGMARRVALARAIALDPEIIMYDEPFAGLDPISMSITANLIRTLNDTTGATSLVVSHDVEECFRICDYAYLMSSQGRVAAHGKPAELAASEDPGVRQFVRGEPDGPVRFHYPARPLAEDLGVGA
jgi:phospholipid/cholesterol/gamma-HCH transport system ATP-binding protein